MPRCRVARSRRALLRWRVRVMPVLHDSIHQLRDTEADIDRETTALAHAVQALNVQKQRCVCWLLSGTATRTGYPRRGEGHSAQYSVVKSQPAALLRIGRVLLQARTRH